MVFRRGGWQTLPYHLTYIFNPTANRVKFYRSVTQYYLLCGQISSTYCLYFFNKNFSGKFETQDHYSFFEEQDRLNNGILEQEGIEFHINKPKIVKILLTLLTPLKQNKEGLRY